MVAPTPPVVIRAACTMSAGLGRQVWVSKPRNAEGDWSLSLAYKPSYHRVLLGRAIGRDWLPEDVEGNQRH